ncbi:phosphoribosylformylglycinamidine synthase subunit PurS [Vagococcus sp. CY53-2]|uniref:phosphoribosylformylglycinamidine synthase subunit PurS n=1 Tax=Vagococcus sp. CY53-2 TaxID=2925780 RepID=UPI001F50FA80|nr:phosphoribosylformylglycinamidine synthase subunit PurS [Vagococcus sp. CY53-2]MCI0130588.1 phosphoribosylformylglycinamidine synthase subunit PurS [Vagococcus sp. CY53-2]
MFKVRVYVNYKASILDPQAAVIDGAIKRLGEDGVSDIRVGKVFDFVIKADSKQDAEAKVDKISDNLLANPNMETYDFTVTEVN